MLVGRRRLFTVSSATTLSVTQNSKLSLPTMPFGVAAGGPLVLQSLAVSMQPATMEVSLTCVRACVRACLRACVSLSHFACLPFGSCPLCMARLGARQANPDHNWHASALQHRPCGRVCQGHSAATALQRAAQWGMLPTLINEMGGGGCREDGVADVWGLVQLVSYLHLLSRFVWS